MKLCLIFASAAFVTGMVAAFKWYESSVVPVDLGYPAPGLGDTYKRSGFTLPRTPESGDAEMQRMNEAAALYDAMQDAAKLNKAAAVWTAGTVMLTGLSALVGCWS